MQSVFNRHVLNRIMNALYWFFVLEISLLLSIFYCLVNVDSFAAFVRLWCSDSHGNVFLGRQQVAVLVGMTFLVIELVSCGRDGRELFGKLNLLGFN